MQILFTPKAPSLKKNTTTQHTKDSSFFTCHLITGDISRAGTADIPSHTAASARNQVMLWAVCSRETGREMREEQACTVQFGIICHIKVNQQQSHRKRGGRIREKQSLM